MANYLSKLVYVLERVQGQEPILHKPAPALTLSPSLGSLHHAHRAAMTHVFILA